MVGTLAQFPVDELKKPLEMRGAYDGKEAYAIRTEKDRVLLLGATETGASYAVYQLLETLGCRWFFPAKEWEVVPEKKTLSYGVNETSRPAILSRNVWYGYGPFPDPGVGVYQSRSWLEYLTWKKRNRLGGSITTYAGHIWQSIIIANAETFAQHPEYLPLVNGVRQTFGVLH